MSAISINTSDYLEEKHILVDGHDWTIKLPGAGTELKLSQTQRRIKLLDKMIKDETATKEDFDLYDRLENETITLFENIFSDGTEDNKTVKEWIQNTPLAVIMAAFESIKEQAEANDTAKKAVNAT